MEFKITSITIFTMGFVFLLFSTIYNDKSSKEHEVYALLPNALKVKIESPVNGQQVPTGNLQVNGSSTDDAQTDCVVSLALNRKLPYRTAMAAGPGGANDYSSWTFTFNSSYAIKPGQNRIAAKISCPEDPALAKGASLNVTGVTSSSSLSSQQTTTLQPTAQQPTPLPFPYAEQGPPNAVQGISSPSSHLLMIDGRQQWW
jgi:hypothetical protein